MFRRKINPYDVSDKVTFQNVDKTLTLYVKSGAGSIVMGLNEASEKIKELKNDSDEEQRTDAARFFASVIFGEKQADQLLEFYGDPIAVISAIGLYFNKQLKFKITKAQKR